MLVPLPGAGTARIGIKEVSRIFREKTASSTVSTYEIKISTTIPARNLNNQNDFFSSGTQNFGGRSRGLYFLSSATWLKKSTLTCNELHTCSTDTWNCEGVAKKHWESDAPVLFLRWNLTWKKNRILESGP